jgi:hypothetical protein
MKPHIFAAIAVAFSLVACGGGGSKDTAKTSTTSGGTTSTGGTGTTTAAFKPTATPVNVSFSGTAATGAPVSNAPITAYDAKGKPCGTAVTSSQGTFSITSKCQFPVLIAADTPDLQGREVYAIVPTIESDGQSVPVNVTPMTTALLFLTNGSMPAVGSVLSATNITKVKLAAAQAKINELLQPILTNLSIANAQDFQSGPITVGQEQDLFLDQVTIAYEKVTSTGQAIMRFSFPSENRPIALVMDTSDPASLRVDAGLGITPVDVDVNRLRKAKALIPDISSMINGKTSAQINANTDPCFLHNGQTDTSNDKIIFDAAMPWNSIVPVASNVRLIRYNTKIDFDNTTTENINPDIGELALISFDYTTPRGALAKTYTWVVKGSQTIRNCSTSTSTWKVIGNQRISYVRSNPYALHKIDYNSAFSGRTDTYGTGLEFNISDYGTNFVYALISGPGMAPDGAVFLKIDGDYLYADTTPLKIRQAALLKINAGTQITDIKTQLPLIVDTVKDTKSVLITDTNIGLIQDSFYRNIYTIRLFKNYDDLFPTTTIEEVLPKRPQLSTEIKAANYPSLGVNLDNLVTALQIPQFLDINWSLPTDSRDYPLQSYKIGFMRKNCINGTAPWPTCTKRSQQANEYFFANQFIDKDTISTSMNTLYAPPNGTKTFESRLRVFVIDNMNRPLEVSVGMNYQK